MSDEALPTARPRRIELPPELSERARAVLLEEGWSPAIARDAATVVLLRQTPDGPQTYLLRRVSTMAFAAGMHVFPGGRVDAADSADLPWLDSVPIDRLMARTSAAPGVARALVVAAVRETFEEAGVLVARHASGADLVADPRRWERARLAVLNREASFGEVLRDLDAVIDPALLPSWDHWVTPEVEPRRYDTRFFVAALPAGQETVEVGGEAAEVLWIDPAGALESHREGQFELMPPTVAVLTSLRAFRTVADVLAAAPERSIRPLLPTAVPTDTAVEWWLLDARSREVVATGDGVAE